MGLKDKVKGLFSGKQKDNGGAIPELESLLQREVLKGDSLDRESLENRINKSRNVLDNVSVRGEEDCNLNNNQINEIKRSLENIER